MVYNVIKLCWFRNLFPFKIYPFFAISHLWNPPLNLLFFSNLWDSIDSYLWRSSRRTSHYIVIIDQHPDLRSWADIFMEVFNKSILITGINLWRWFQTIRNHPSFLYLHLEFPQFSFSFSDTASLSWFINRLLSNTLYAIVTRSKQDSISLIWSHAFRLLYYDLLFH